MNINNIVFLIFIGGCINMSCVQPEAFELNYTVKAAPEWDRLFIRDSGWFGGDGIFAIPMTGKEHQLADPSDSTIILFSDTMIGEIIEDSLMPGYRMVNNSIAIMTGSVADSEKIDFKIDKNAGNQDQSLFIPDLPDRSEQEYYWLGDGFVNPLTSKLHIFAYRVQNHPEYEVFSFDVEGGALITIPPGSSFPYREHYQKSLPFFFKHGKQLFGSFGAGVFVNLIEAGAPNPDGFIYIYGVNDPNKQLIVARVEAALFEEFESWTFWDGAGWNEDFTNCAAITEHVSNELSVSFLPNGKLVLVSQVGDLAQSQVGIRIGESPIGPFGPVVRIWNCEESLEEPEFFAYNAKAHPSLSKPGELLISYNVNSFAFWNQIEDYPNLYRPRFIKLIISKS